MFFAKKTKQALEASANVSSADIVHKQSFTEEIAWK
jgi:hypothetical protein